MQNSPRKQNNLCMTNKNVQSPRQGGGCRGRSRGWPPPGTAGCGRGLREKLRPQSATMQTNALADTPPPCTGDTRSRRPARRLLAAAGAVLTSGFCAPALQKPEVKRPTTVGDVDRWAQSSPRFNFRLFLVSHCRWRNGELECRAPETRRSALGILTSGFVPPAVAKPNRKL